MNIIHRIRKFMTTTKFIDYEKGPADKMFLNERNLVQTPDHYLMKIKAIGLNRAETLHRLGRYPITNDVEKYLGL